jgi:BlaI family transcriptional regulator, penicillinase repressor
MSDAHPLDGLGARERQIMDILFRLGRATANDVQRELGEPVSNSAVRGMLRLLASKGLVELEQDGPRYVYFPAHRSEDVSHSALRHVVATFFRSSPSSAMAALLESANDPISDEEYDRMVKLLEQARAGGER